MHNIELNIPPLPFNAYKMASSFPASEIGKLKDGSSIYNLFNAFIIISAILLIVFRSHIPFAFQFTVTTFLYIILFLIFKIYTSNRIFNNFYARTKSMRDGYTLLINENELCIKTDISKQIFSISFIEKSILWNKSIYIVYFQNYQFLWIPEDVIAGHENEEAIRQLFKISHIEKKN